MSDHRRPNDHLVEPLFGGLDGAQERSRTVRQRSYKPLIVALVLVVVTVASYLAL